MILKINGKITDISKCKGYRPEDFDPDQIFDCGQCFRWEKNAEGIWETPENLCRASKDSSQSAVLLEDLHRYFDFDRDYGEIKKYLSASDPIMSEAIKAGSGIRILNQPKWETLISFIISQNNNIPRIKGCINNHAQELGRGGQLPTPEALAGECCTELGACRLGYRDRYLTETACQILREPTLLDDLASPDVSAAEAVEALQKLSGVGPKVASCIALFCLGKVDSFPIDVWMKRVMNQLYGIPENDVKSMKKYAEEHFAPYGGIAQQYLFYFITHKGVDNGQK